MKKYLNFFIALAILLIVAGGGYWYIKQQQEYPSTSDAYVHGNIIYIAPQVSAKIIKSHVQNYQYVAKGMLLFELDPTLFQAQLDEANAAYQMAVQNNTAQDDAIVAANANVNSTLALLADAQVSYARINDLVGKKLLPEQQLDDEKAKLAAAEQNVVAARATVAELIKSQGAKGDAAPEVKKAAAALAQATLALSYTNIAAPFDGFMGKVGVHDGSVVGAGQALAPLVVDNSFWIEANYKETNLSRIRAGMPAQITLDIYPDIVFNGKVKAISYASGSSFSLLPPENATGNWVKIPQRFPLVIELDKQHPYADKPLRIGASAEVVINTLAPPTQP